MRFPSLPSQSHLRALLFFLGVWGGFYIPRVMMGVYRPVLFPLANIEARPWYEEAARFDPPLGSRLPLAGLTQAYGPGQPPLQQGGPSVLMFLWDCEACGLIEKLEWLQGLAYTHRHTRVSVVILRGDVERARAFFQQSHLRLPVYVDVSGEAARSLNASVPGRTYLFDSTGSLRYLSGFEQSWSEITADLKKVLDGP